MAHSQVAVIARIWASRLVNSATATLARFGVEIGQEVSRTMSNRIAVPLLAVALLAAPAFGAEPSPKPSPVASPKVVSSPKASPTPAKHATRTRGVHKVVASAKPSTRRHTHVLTPAKATAPNAAPTTNGVAK